MAYNTKKKGYSLNEIAQMIGCAYCTVLRLVNKGDLKAIKQDKLSENGRRRFRVTRRHLIEYMTEHKNKFAPELLEAFHIDLTENKEVAVEKTEDVKEGFIEGTTSVPTGAWASAFNTPIGTDFKETVEPKIAKKTNDKEIESKKSNTCSIIVNGRIAVANISKETALKIVTCLSEDECIKMDTLSIGFS